MAMRRQANSQVLGRIALLGVSGLFACQAAPGRVNTVTVDRPDLPLAAATDDELRRFREGDRLFEVPFRESDGLGPLYIRSSCEACHQSDGRGPGLVPKMAVVESDGVTPAADQSLLPFGATERPYLSAGARQPLSAPEGEERVRRSLRLPPAVFGRGYLEAIADGELTRLATEAAFRTNGIRGRLNRVSYNSERNPGASPVHDHRPGQTGIVGRFGLKARIATLDEFAADALQGDMGLTTPVRPVEPPNPDGLSDDRRPGIDLPLSAVNALADYLRLIDIPPRPPEPTQGRALFTATLCAACHVPELMTRPDYPVRSLAGIAAPVFTDLLLHDMGTALADGVSDGAATGREWRTAPLIGLRFSSAMLHDGRARNVDEAIRAHAGPGSEANVAVDRFLALQPEARAELIHFVEGL